MNRDAFLKHNIDINDVIKDYENGLSLNDLVDKYEVSKRTIQRRFKKLNVQMRPTGKPFDLEKEKRSSHTSSFAQWLRKNPNIILPKSATKISEISGVPTNVINTYLYTRKKYADNFKKNLDLNKYPKPYLITTEKKLIPILGIKSFNVEIDYDKKIVVLDILLKIGSRKKVVLSMKEAKTLLRSKKCQRKTSTSSTAEEESTTQKPC